MFLKFTGCAIAAALVGYCIYFDKQRRMDPNYKQKILERRLYRKRSSELQMALNFPNPNDQEAVERFYTREIELGKALMTRGEIEKGVEHLAKAIIVFGQVEHSLKIIQKSFPPNIFVLISTKVQSLNERIRTTSNRGCDKLTE